MGNSGAGVEIEGNDLTVGGLVSGAGNVIAGNGGDGVRTAGNAEDVSIVGNRIGTTVLGASGNSARGVSLSAGTDITVGGSAAGAANAITGNGLGGISTNSPTSFDVQRNSIFANNGLGIDLEADLSPTPNDGSAEADGNQNFPVLTSAITGGGATNVTGSLVSNPSPGVPDRPLLEHVLRPPRLRGGADVPRLRHPEYERLRLGRHELHPACGARGALYHRCRHATVRRPGAPSSRSAVR